MYAGRKSASLCVGSQIGESQPMGRCRMAGREPQYISSCASASTCSCPQGFVAELACLLDDGDLSVLCHLDNEGSGGKG